MADHGKHDGSSHVGGKKEKAFEPIRKSAPSVGRRITPQNNPRISSRSPNNRREVPVA